VEGASQGPAAEEHGCMIISNCGTGTATSSGSITNCTLRFGSRKAEKRARQWLLSTRRPPRAHKKGGSSLDPSGYDAGKKIKGRKRHILVDTLGLLLNIVVHPADI
jgi:Transposase DDE domain